MKEMNKVKRFMRMNLQHFAGEGADDSKDDAGDGDDDQDESSDDKKSDKKADKTFTQAELDIAIEKRLKRERNKAEKKTETKDDKQSDKGADDKSKATDDKVSGLEAKLLCFEHEVSKDCVADVVALAKAYIDEDTDFEEAIEKVIKKYPQFVKGSDKKKDDEDEDDTTNKKGSWGDRQKGTGKKMSGVEAAFVRNNPDLKID